MKFLGLFLLVISTAFAQTASVTGRVTDATGAVVPQAGVTVQAVDSGVSATDHTNDQGYYNFPSLLPGLYNLTVNKTGFKIVRAAQLKLTVQQAARVDLVLDVGTVNETVDVNAQAVLLDSESSTVGQLVGNRQVSELPLLGRNPYALAMLVPGVRQSIGVNNLPIDQISTVSITINGQRASANEFLLDGAPNSAPSQNQPVIYANPDSVQEFKVDTNTFSAEYGRAAGGIFNVITKSGTNDPHFTLYEFFRNDKLNANDFFANKGGSARPPFKFNQFGGSIGGPVEIPKVYDGKNKTFSSATLSSCASSRASHLPEPSPPRSNWRAISARPATPPAPSSRSTIRFPPRRPPAADSRELHSRAISFRPIESTPPRPPFRNFFPLPTLPGI